MKYEPSETLFSSGALVMSGAYIPVSVHVLVVVVVKNPYTSLYYRGRP